MGNKTDIFCYTYNLLSNLFTKRMIGIAVQHASVKQQEIPIKEEKFLPKLSQRVIN